MDPFLKGEVKKKAFHSHHLGEAQGRPTTSTRMEHARGRRRIHAKTS